MSIQDLQQNPQDTSNFYLANMYRATIYPNASSSLPASPPPFTPPNYAVWVNAFWFLSLVISITCALLATLLQQWARRYLKVTQPRYSPHKRARIRAFFAEGVDKFLLPWAVEALPTMLHISLFLFFSGLAVFLWNVNLTIFKLVLSWIGLCTAIYGCITFIPVFRHDSPYHTPLSLPAWHFITGIRFLTFRALTWITLSFDFFSGESYDRFRHLAEDYGKFLVQGMQKTAEESAFSSPPEIDIRAFMWTFDCLDEDHELEHFFAGLPGFRNSKVVKDPLPYLPWEQQNKILDALIGLFDRTSSSDLLQEQVKFRRTVICRKAIGPLDIPQAIQPVLRRIFHQGQDGLGQSAAMARLVRGWDDGKGKYTTTIIRAIVSSVVARAQRRDDLWFTIAADAMGLPESVLRNHATHGDNLSFVILIYVVRQQFSLYGKRNWPWQEFSKVLEAASEFDVLDTSPELQHSFCALWNQVRSEARGTIPWWILRPIRNIYLTLHLHTNSAPTILSTSTGDDDDILNRASTYPLCNIPGHHPDSAPHIHDVSTSLPISRAVLHDNTAPLTFSIVSTSDTPFPPLTALTIPVHVGENALDVPPHDNMSLSAPSFRADQIPMENLCDSATSPDKTVVAATQDNYSTRMFPTIRETSLSTSSVPPPAVVSFQNNTDLLAHSGAPEILSSASPEQVLNGITSQSRLLPIFFP